MDHGELSQLFLKWFAQADNYQGWFVFPNRSGFASVERVPYGLPPGGGGFDYLALGNGQAKWFEVKTIDYPTLSKKQKTFRANMTGQGFKCWIVREEPSLEDGFYIISADKYRPCAKYPY